MERLTTLHIDKENHKFSAAHYTIFGPGERERLHGHNYSVSTRILAPMGDNGFSADYNVYKERIKQLCDELDEYMLLAADSPHQSIAEQGDYYRVQFAGEEMLFLRSDTLVLPIRNATVEEFAHYLLGRLLALSAG
jgi:6-pyruvoyltetrahydropterin/6-carboxytetrahydropterin synthase